MDTPYRRPRTAGALRSQPRAIGSPRAEPRLTPRRTSAHPAPNLGPPRPEPRLTPRRPPAPPAPTLASPRADPRLPPRRTSAHPAPNLGSPAPTLRSPAPAVDHRPCSEASQSRRARPGRAAAARFITVDDQVARGRGIPAPLTSDVRGMSTGGDHRTAARRHDGGRRRDAAPT